MVTFDFFFFITNLRVACHSKLHPLANYIYGRFCEIVKKRKVKGDKDAPEMYVNRMHVLSQPNETVLGY